MNRLTKVVFLIVASYICGATSFLLQAQSYDEDEYLCQIIKFRKVWAGKTIKVPPTRDGNVGLKDFARAFARVYRHDNYMTNEILEYFADPAGYMREYGEDIIVDYKPRNGYFVIQSYGDGDSFEMCYWNRDNGHKLVGIHWGMEVDCDAFITVFYDYDPNTSTLAPEVRLTQKLEENYGHRSSYELNPFKSVLVHFPVTGKDLSVLQYESDQTITLHWDGMTFTELQSVKDAIEYIFRETWSTKVIKVPPTRDGSISLKDLVRAFARAYNDDYSITNEILEYFVDPSKYLKIKDDYVWVDYKPQTGYFGIEEKEGSRLEFFCWERKNGHTLVGVFWCGYDDMGLYSTVFYDYSPNVQELTPELELTEKLVQKYGKASDRDDIPFKNVFVEFPKQGQNLTVIDGDYDYRYEYTLHWDGMTFTELQ